MAHVPNAADATLTPFSLVHGTTVLDHDGERAGTVAEVMMETAAGRIAYVALSVGGVLGVGERLFALPWDAFAVDPIGGEVRLRFAASAFDGHDGFDKDAWPTAADTRFGERR